MTTPTFTGAPAPVQISAGAGMADREQVPRDAYGRYLIPEPRWADGTLLSQDDLPFSVQYQGDTTPRPWTRVTTVVHTLSDKRGVQRWSERLAIKGLATRPDLFALTAATPMEDKFALDNIVSQAKDAASGRAAANLGQAVHGWTDAVDRGVMDPNEIPMPWRLDVLAYRNALAGAGLQLLPGMSECRVVLPTIGRTGKVSGLAGMFDRMVMDSATGEVFVLDVKTGSDPLRYGAAEIAMQLWCYANAHSTWDGVRFLPLPDNLSKVTGIVAHLPVGKNECTLYDLDLTGADAGIELAVAVRNYRSSSTLSRVRTAGVSAAGIDPCPESPVAASVALEPAVALAVDSVPSVVTEVAPEAEELAPIVHDPKLVPAGTVRCSYCHRLGHRKGSPKCLGDADPGNRKPVPVEEPVENLEIVLNPVVIPAGLVPNAKPISSVTDFWMNQVNECTSPAELRAVRERAKAAGAWTNAHLERGLELVDAWRAQDQQNVPQQ